MSRIVVTTHSVDLSFGPAGVRGDAAAVGEVTVADAGGVPEELGVPEGKGDVLEAVEGVATVAGADAAAPA